jgi:hypothetical protein
VSDLVSHIDRIRGASDRQALYVECLRQSMMSSDGRSRLGIYRIGCEGGFDLASSYEEQVLTITASREI